GNLSAENTVTFTAAVAASGHPGVVLFDTPTSAGHTKNFLTALRAEAVVPVGSFPEGVTELERRLGVKAGPVCPWTRGVPAGLWKALFPEAPRVVVCPAEPRRLFLQAACLAGAVHAPLYVLHAEPGEVEELGRWLKGWQTREVLAVGAAGKL